MLLDLICMSCKQEICSYCVLFGVHKDHLYKIKSEVEAQISKATQLLENSGNKC